MKILGLSAFTFDAAASIIYNGEVITSANEDMFTVKPAKYQFPLNSIKHCLTECNLKVDELDAVAFYSKPMLRFERVLETYYALAPKGMKSFLSSMPEWINHNILIKKLISDNLRKAGKFNRANIRFLFPEQHLSFSANAFYTSPFTESAILILDNCGEWATISIGHGHNNNIKVIRELRYPHSLELLYKSALCFLGINYNEQGFDASSIKADSLEHTETKRFVELLKRDVIDIKYDGSYILDQKFFEFSNACRMIRNTQWTKIFGIQKPENSGRLLQSHHNLLAALRIIIDEIFIRLLKEVKMQTQSTNLCLVNNLSFWKPNKNLLLNSGLFDEIFVGKERSKESGAIGAALATYYIYYKEKRIINRKSIYTNNPENLIKEPLKNFAES